MFLNFNTMQPVLFVVWYCTEQIVLDRYLCNSTKCSSKAKLIQQTQLNTSLQKISTPAFTYPMAAQYPAPSQMVGSILTCKSAKGSKTCMFYVWHMCCFILQRAQLHFHTNTYNHMLYDCRCKLA